MREWILGALLAVAAGLVVVGAAMASTALAFVVAGVLLAGLAWLLFGELGGDDEVGE